MVSGQSRSCLYHRINRTNSSKERETRIYRAEAGRTENIDGREDNGLMGAIGPSRKRHRLRGIAPHRLGYTGRDQLNEAKFQVVCLIASLI